jgi:hypothetical protein
MYLQDVLLTHDALPTYNSRREVRILVPDARQLNTLNTAEKRQCMYFACRTVPTLPLVSA